jgi:hypothetical protein
VDFALFGEDLLKAMELDVVQLPPRGMDGQRRYLVPSGVAQEPQRHEAAAGRAGALLAAPRTHALPAKVLRFSVLLDPLKWAGVHTSERTKKPR